MSDKLYLLTEAELRAMLAEAYHCEDCAGPDTDYAHGYAGNVIDRLTTLSSDWSKAPEWAEMARKICEYGPWIPRPTEDTNG